jgi:hypothetical protein
VLETDGSPTLPVAVPESWHRARRSTSMQRTEPSPIARRVLLLFLTGLAILSWRLWRNPAREATESELTGLADLPGRIAAPPVARVVSTGSVDLGTAPHIESEPSLIGGAVSGWVLSEGNAEPIAAELTLGTAGTVHVIRSGADGKFEFQAPAPGEYRLLGVTAKGFAPRLWTWTEGEISFELSVGRRVDGVRLSLTPLETCAGQTIFSDGGVAVGAQVSIHRPNAESSPVDIESTSTTSDDAGSFELPCALSDAVQATLGEFLSVQVEADVEPLLLVLGREESRSASALSIEGLVVDSEGRPLQGISIRAFSETPAGSGNFSSKAGVTVHSNADGHFVLAPLAAGTYSLSLWSDGFETGSAVVVEAGATEVMLKAEAEGSVEVRVMDASSAQPISVFEVGLVPYRQTEGKLHVNVRRGQLSIGGSNMQRIEHVPVGRYGVWAGASGYHGPRFTEVVVRANSTAQTELRLKPGERVHGSVRDARTLLPIAKARVIANTVDWEKDQTMDSSRTVFTDAYGEFTLDGVTDTTRFRIEASGYRSWAQRGASVTLNIELVPADADAGDQTEYGGVGLSWKEESRSTVESVVSGGPAERAGIRPGDILTKVNDEKVEHIVGIRRMLEGPIGTTVRLSFRRPDGGALEEVLVRDRFLFP